METTFKKITKQLNESIEKPNSFYIEIFEEYNNLEKIKSKLFSFNLINSKTYKDIINRLELIESYYIEHQKNTLLKQDYSKYKLIDLSTFYKICKENNLVKGSLNQYLGTIPIRCIEDIEQYNPNRMSDVFIFALPSDFDLTIPKTEVDPIIYEVKTIYINEKQFNYASIITSWGDEEFLFKNK